MSIGEQIGNIGGEVERAIRYKKKGEPEKERDFYKKALDFLELTIKDPKNMHRIGELNACKEELKDYFDGNNMYGTTEETLVHYYDAFLV